ncbi:hypothetical protein CQY20_30010 [Mycolicibacterium agri]|uniref:Uncharacterized protein n=1 Tax=Mycolicibacterium agri TaxID=36811 RepID=A0A2A7MPH6_MYCAG|nr:hypothetical protein [Mycolicibacterium agri]PEG33584.1 hypothetical protein CQY20_30010 [Mycolicibacterium agri]GFG52362.1 hypothetical protein MAGR_38030 [Mycolicibacterium agri]
MTVRASTALPTLGQLRDWDVARLDVAADAWVAQAQRWQNSLTTVLQAVSATDFHWQGAAADAATQRLDLDHRVVVDAADRLKEAAAVARRGAAEIRDAQQEALQRVAQARTAGLQVEDDLSVTYIAASPGADLQEVQAEAYARSIWRSAHVLAATDEKVARELTAAAAGLQHLWFPADQTDEWPQTLLAGYTGSLPLPETPNLVYCHPSARPDFWWCEGFDIGSGPYAFGSPFDASGVA